MLKALEKYHGRSAPRLRLPNARDPGNFLPAAKEDFILTAGRLWDEAKNIRDLKRSCPFVSGQSMRPELRRPRMAARPGSTD